jgi:membrane protein
MKGYRDRLDWLLQLAYTTWRLYQRNGLTNHAAATAFYFLLSATPLLLLLTYAIQWLADLAEQSVPATILLAALYQQFRLDALAQMGFIPQHVKLGAGSVGLATLLLASRKLVHSIEGAFKVIFPEEAKRRFVVSWTLPFIIIPIAFLLVGLAVAVQGALNFLVQAEMMQAARGLLLSVLNLMLVFGTVWALVLVAYWRLPLQHPRLRHAAALALLSSLTLYLLFTLFGVFFKIEQYRSLYGALGGVVFVLIAAYFAFMAFYFWAQCLYALSKVDVAALERLFLAGGGEGANRLEGLVFGRANRLLAKYGRRFAAGEAIIREGDDSKTAFYIYAGRVRLTRQVNGEQRHLTELAEGELFGEMAYLLGEKRTATVTAVTEVVVLALPPDLLEALMRYSAPLSRRIIHALCLRLMHMNQTTAGSAIP